MKFKHFLTICFAGVSMCIIAQTHVEGVKDYNADKICVNTSELSKFDPNNFSEVFHAANDGNKFAIVRLMNHEWSENENTQRDNLKIDNIKDIYENISLINPGNDPKLNYYCGIAWRKKAEYALDSDADLSSDDYPYIPMLAKAAKAGYLDSVDLFYTYAVWGATSGNIPNDPEYGYKVLEDLENEGNIDALRILSQSHVLNSLNSAMPYAIKLANHTNKKEDIENAVSIICRLVDINEIAENDAIAKIENLANLPDRAQLVYRLAYDNIYEKENLKKQFLQKGIDINDCYAFLEKGNYYFCGDIKNLNIKKAAEYYEKAFQYATPEFKEKQWDWKYEKLLKRLVAIYNSDDIQGLYDRDKRLKYLKALADIGSAEGMLLLGDYYYDNHSEQMKWYTKAEKQLPEKSLYKQIIAYQYYDNTKMRETISKLKDIKNHTSYYYLAQLCVDLGSLNDIPGWLNPYFKYNHGTHPDYADAIIIYSMAKQHNPARIIHSEELLIKNLYENQRWNSDAHWMYGCLMIFQGQYKKGIECLENAIQIAMESGNITDCSTELLILADIYSGKGEIYSDGKSYTIPSRFANPTRAKIISNAAFGNFEYDDM